MYEEAKIRVGSKLEFEDGSTGRITAVSTLMVSVGGEIVATVRVNYRRYNKEGRLVLVRTDRPAREVFRYLKEKRVVK